MPVAFDPCSKMEYPAPEADGEERRRMLKRAVPKKAVLRFA